MVIMEDRPDGHFYSDDKGRTWYESVTAVLRSYPKGQKFYEWVAKNGYNAENIKQSAGNVGTSVHKAIEALVSGYEDIDRLCNRYNLGPAEHIALVGFKRWNEARQPKIVCQEKAVVSHRMEVGGTVDLVAELDGEHVVIDFKTSKYVQPSHWLQLHAYAFALHESGICTAKRLMVLHLHGKHETCYQEIPKPYRHDTLRQFYALRYLHRFVDRNDRNRSTAVKFDDRDSPADTLNPDIYTLDNLVIL